MGQRADLTATYNIRIAIFLQSQIKPAILSPASGWNKLRLRLELEALGSKIRLALNLLSENFTPDDKYLG